MSITSEKTLTLPESAIQAIEQRMTFLSENGVTVSQQCTGELNFSGCASGYCQAWA